MAQSSESGTVLVTARSAQITPSSGRPEMTIQLAREVAARAPMFGSLSGLCADQAATRRSSVFGDPVYTPRRPSRASRRALVTRQLVRTRAAPSVSAAPR